MDFHHLITLIMLNISIRGSAPSSKKRALIRVQWLGMSGKLPKYCWGKFDCVENIGLMQNAPRIKKKSFPWFKSIGYRIDYVKYLSPHQKKNVTFKSNKKMSFYLNQTWVYLETEVLLTISESASISIEFHRKEGRNFTLGTGTFENLTFTLAISHKCLPYYYTWNCTKYCKPRDNEDGHYNCTPQGERICLEGYYAVPECIHRNHCIPEDRCQNNGSCIPNVTQCFCKEPFTGPNCTRIKAVCSPSSCKDTEYCLQELDRYAKKCICRENFKRINKECTPIPGSCSCLNGGSCILVNGTTKCICQVGYEGTWCTRDIDECSNREQYCKYAKGCNNTEGGYTCDCERPAYGKNCDKCEVTLNEHGKCFYGLNDNYFWYAVAIALLLILYSCSLSVYFWRHSVKAARSAITQRLIAQRLANAAANIRN